MKVSMFSAFVVAGAALAVVRNAHAQEPMTEPQVGGATVETPPIEPPEPPDASIRRHDGFYLRFGIGFGGVGGTYEPDEADETFDVSGGGGSSELALGGTIAPGLVLGGGLYGVGTIATRYENGGEADAKALNVGMLGPFIDYYFDERAGGHLMFSLGFAGIQQQDGEDLNEAINGGGWGAMIGGGYEWFVGEQWSLGVIARVQYVAVSTKTEDSEIEGTMSLIAPAVLFGVTYH